VLRNRNCKGYRHFDTLRDAPDGSPSSRVSPTMLVPFRIHPGHSKRSPHPSMRGADLKAGLVRLNVQKNTYIGEKTSQKWLKINNMTLTNLFLRFHGAGWPNERWVEVVVVVSIRDQYVAASLISIPVLSEPKPSQSPIFGILSFQRYAMHYTFPESI